MAVERYCLSNQYLDKSQKNFDAYSQQPKDQLLDSKIGYLNSPMGKCYPTRLATILSFRYYYSQECLENSEFMENFSEILTFYFQSFFYFNYLPDASEEKRNFATF